MLIVTRPRQTAEIPRRQWRAELTGVPKRCISDRPLGQRRARCPDVAERSLSSRLPPRTHCLSPRYRCILNSKITAAFSSYGVCSSCESSTCLPQPVVPRQRLVTSSILRRLDARVQRRWPCSENPGGLSRLRSSNDRPDVNQQARS